MPACLGGASAPDARASTPPPPAEPRTGRTSRTAAEFFEVRAEPHHARAKRLPSAASVSSCDLRAFVLRRRHPAPSPRCGSIGNELRAPRRLRAPRPTQAPSRRWPARPGGDSRRLLSTPVDYPSMREGRRLDALRSLQARRQARSRHNSSRAPCSRLHKASRECYNLHARSSERT